MQNNTWGGRFNKSLDQRAAQFNASFAFDHVLYPYDIAGSKVHVTMLAKQGLINENESLLLCTELDKIKAEFDQGQFSLENSAEDIHMYIEQLLIERLGDVGKKVHTGRSRNDQVALDLRLYIRDASEAIEKHLTHLHDTIDKLSKQYQHDVVPGYTHLQQAQPIRLGAYFEAYLNMFKRDHQRLLDWRARMNYSPLGAGALAGSGLPLDRQWTAEQLGFSGIIENTLDAVSDRDYVIEFCCFSSIIMMHLSRLSEDLIIWATQEFNFVILDDAFCTGSSLMPNKKNPDILELIRGKSGRVFGHLVAMLTIMKGLPLAYNKDMQEDKEALFDTVITLHHCLEIVSPFLSSLSFNLNRMRETVENGYLNATALMEALVLAGIPLREAHHRIGELVKFADSNGISLNEASRINHNEKK